MTADDFARLPAPPHRASRGPAPAAAIDAAFLDAQTFGDPQLRREVLGLFVAQSRQVVPGLPALNPREQADAAHLLNGSARAIGAWAAAASAAAYGAADPERRAASFPALERAFAGVEAAILADRAGGDAGDGPT